MKPGFENECNNNATDGIALDTFSATDSDDNTITKNICNDNGDDCIELMTSSSNNVTFNECNQNGDLGINDTGTGNRIFNNSAIDNVGGNYSAGITQIKVPGDATVEGSNFSVI